SGRRGFSLLDGQPVIIVGYGITTTNMTGPARGTLVMVRKFDADRLNYVAQQTQLAITFEALSKSAAPPGITETDWARILSGAIITKPANDTVMTGATVITGIENKPSMILISVETSRPVYQQVQQSIVIVAVAIILLSIFLILVVQTLLQRFILAPLSTLDEDIKVIGKSGNISRSVVARGDEEIVSLAGSLNRMFKEIHTAHQRTFQSEAKFRALTENTPDIIFSATLDGTFTYISPQIEKYGFKVDEMIGTSGLPFVFPEDREPLLDSFKKGLEDGHRSSIHFRILDKWQNVHWLEVNYAMIMDSSGNCTGLHGMFRDITDRRQNLDAITLANKKLNLMYDITRHDILNKIAILFGLVDMTKASTSPDEREQFLNEIRNASDAIYRQIALTRNYQEVGVKSPQWNSVKEVIGRVVANFSGTGVEFKSDIENLEVYADPLIEKVIYNLVDNAIRYGKTITTISFSARPLENGIELICEDDGIGIDAGIKEKIFERGFGSNTGLGLFLAREILMITGITIRETGEPGKGARFVMFLPKGTYRFT
ncbi:MAG: PAS domain S-box protein, partial [Methanoregula sp.]